MGMLERLTTVISTKGQVVLPQAIRDMRHWPAGTRLTVGDTPEAKSFERAFVHIRRSAVTYPFRSRPPQLMTESRENSPMKRLPSGIFA